MLYYMLYLLLYCYDMVFITVTISTWEAPFLLIEQDAHELCLSFFFMAPCRR